MSEEEIESLWDLDTADFDRKTIVALKYVEHLAMNDGKVLDPQVLRNMQERYTDKQVRFLYHAWAWGRCGAWMGNSGYSLGKKLHLFSRARLYPAGTVERGD